MKLGFGKNKIDKFLRNRWLLTWLAVFLLIVMIVVLPMVIKVYYQEKVFPGLKVAGINMGGKDEGQVKALIQARFDKLLQDGLTYKYEDKELVMKGIISGGAEVGSAYEVWVLEKNKTVDRVMNFGRGDDWLKNYANIYKAFFWGKDFQVGFLMDDKKIINVLRDNFGEFEILANDADFDFSDGEIKMVDENDGEEFDYEKAIEETRACVSGLCLNGRVDLKLRSKKADIAKSDVGHLMEPAKDIINRTPLTLVYKRPEESRLWRAQTRKWYVYREDFQKWLKIKKDKNEYYIGVDRGVVEDYLKGLSEEVNEPAVDAKFEIQNGRVIEWQSSLDGYKLNTKKTIDVLENVVRVGGDLSIDLVLSIEKSKITNDNVNDLGIKELLGRGESNFSGSPQNRRHNISVGADSINGILIAPDEEFSLITALGDINAESGYKPELVIKEGRTVPEYGGGLCQIGTTLFRAVVNTGLPVTERRNHSYRVSYYEPAGTDATIYDPWPDFKFMNDTGKHILLQTRVEGDSLVFDFWGTGDGRDVKVSDPVIYNIVKPGEPRELESDDLEPGERKKVESAHSGADAYFDRVIEWPDSSEREKIEERFSSHYVPWREMWLVGKTATSTEGIISE